MTRLHKKVSIKTNKKDR